MLLLSQILNLQANTHSTELNAFAKAFDDMMVTFLSKSYTAATLEQSFTAMENVFRDVLDVDAIDIVGGTMGTTTVTISSEEPSPVPANIFEMAQLFSLQSKDPCTSVPLTDFGAQLIKVTHKGGDECVPCSVKIKFESVGAYLEFYADVVIEKYIADLQNIWSSVYNTWRQDFYETSVGVRDGKVQFEGRNYALKDDVQSNHVIAITRAATIMVLRTEAMIAHNLVPAALT